MRQLCRDVDVEFARAERVEIFGKGLPVPRQPLGHHDFGNILDPLHHRDEHVALMRLAGREADPAIAHHGGGHAMVRRGREPVFPQRLPVIMGVDIDEAGGDDPAARIDFLAPARFDAADRGDPPVLDREVRSLAPIAEAVEDRAAANHQVKIVHVPLHPCLLPGDSIAAGRKMSSC